MLKKFFLIVAILILVAVALLAGGVWSFHQYVNSPKFKGELTKKVSDPLTTDFSLGGLQFNLFSGLTLNNLEVKNPPPHQSKPCLKIQNVRLRYNPWSLLGNQLVVSEFSFARPEFNIYLNANGTLNIPQLKKKDSPEAPEPEKSAVVLPSITTDAQLDAVLDHFSLTDGRFLLFNADGQLLFAMKKAQMQGNLKLTDTGADAQGQIKIGQLTIGPQFKIAQVQSPLSFAGKKLSLPEITGRSYNGTAAGSLEADFGAKEPSFRMNIKLTDADIPALVLEFGNDFDWIDGKLQLTSQLEGPLRQPKLLTGKGELEVTEAGLAKFQLLHAFAQALLLPELPHTQFQSIKGTFKVADQKITFFNLEAVSDTLQLSGAGTVGFDRQVDFDVLMALHKKLAERIPSEIRSQFTQREDGFYTITLKVIGKPGELKTNLLEKFTQATAQAALEKFGDQLPEDTQKKAGEILDILKKNGKSTSSDLKDIPAEDLTIQAPEQKLDEMLKPFRSPSVDVLQETPEEAKPESVPQP